MIKERFKMIPAVYLLLWREDKILLMRRAHTGFCDGWYSLPAGHHDGGTLLTEAMVREAYEELGIRIDPHMLTFVHLQHRLKPSDGERADVYFSCKNWEGDVVNHEPHKCDELAWYALDHLPEQIIPTVRTALLDILRGEMYSEIGEE